MPQIIEDPFAGPPVSFANQPAQPAQQTESGYSQGLQMPQPLKTSMHINVPATASTNTLTNFNYYTGNDSANSMAFQTNAIRGKIASPHVYNWNAAIPQQPTIPTPQQQPTLQQSFTTDPKQLLRNAISDVYRNCIMVKTHIVAGYSVFKCPVEGMTAGIFKYIVAVVPSYDHVPLGGQHHLGSLPWISFQTRQTDTPALEFGEVRPQATIYSVPYDNKSPVFEIINMMLEEPTKFIYLGQHLPIKVELLKKKEGDVAASKASLMSALEAFRTVVTFTQF
jgi:hypothetical protein